MAVPSQHGSISQLRGTFDTLDRELVPETTTPAPRRRAHRTRSPQPIQAKLVVGRVDDPLERDADTVARQVLDRLADDARAPWVANPTNTSTCRIRRSTAPPVRLAPRSVDSKIQAKAVDAVVGMEGGDLDTDTDSAIQRAKGKGAPLAPDLRASMESGFEADFSKVRVHTDAGADRLSRQLQAKAFTTGSDIFFRSGDYSPASSSGQKLVAHELAHVVQQGGAGAVRRSPDRTPTVTPDRRQGVIRRGKGDKYALLDESEQDSSGGPKGKKKGGYSELDEEEGEDESAPADPKLEEAAELVAGAEQVLIEQVAEAYKKYAAKKEATKGPVSAQGEMEASAGAGAEFTLTKEGTNLLEGIKYIAAASAKAGVEFNASGAIGVDLGLLQIAASAKLRAFAGIAGEATGTIEMSLLNGLVFEGSVSAMVGAEVTAEGDVSFDLGEIGIGAEGWARLFVGGEASAEGSIAISRKGISMSGSVEAFAGVKADAKASVSFKFKGRPIVKLSAKASALAGVGGEASGEFSISSGKLVISGSLAAALGIGGELGGGIEIDFDAIATGIYETVEAVLAKEHPYKRFRDPSDTIPPLKKELGRVKTALDKKRQPLTGAAVQKAINSALKTAKQDKSPELDLIERFLNEGLAEILGPNHTNYDWYVQWSYVRSFQQKSR